VSTSRTVARCVFFFFFFFFFAGSGQINNSEFCGKPRAEGFAAGFATKKWSDF
jgi:hypothetical protein